MLHASYQLPHTSWLTFGGGGGGGWGGIDRREVLKKAAAAFERIKYWCATAGVSIPIVAADHFNRYLDGLQQQQLAVKPVDFTNIWRLQACDQNCCLS